MPDQYPSTPGKYAAIAAAKQNQPNKLPEFDNEKLAEDEIAVRFIEAVIAMSSDNLGYHVLSKIHMGLQELDKRETALQAEIMKVDAQRQRMRYMYQWAQSYYEGMQEYYEKEAKAGKKR